MAAKAKTTKKKKTTTKKVEEPKNDFDWDAVQAKENQERKVRKMLKLMFGLLFCVGGVWLILRFWPNFVTVFKEWVGVGVILIGLFIILLGILD